MSISIHTFGIDGLLNKIALTSWAHVHLSQKNDSANDEKFEETEKHQYIVDFEIENNPVVVVWHRNIGAVEKGVGLQQQYKYLKGQAVAFARTY